MEIAPTSSSILTEMREINLDSNKIKIQVSNTKKPLFFYLNLAKKYIKIYNYVVLSALGMAIPTAITISQILKSNGVALETKVLTSTIGSKDETNGRMIQKPKIEILMERCENGGGDCSKDSKLDAESETEMVNGGRRGDCCSSKSPKSCSSSSIITQQEVDNTSDTKSNADVVTTSEIVDATEKEEKKN